MQGQYERSVLMALSKAMGSSEVPGRQGEFVTGGQIVARMLKNEGLDHIFTLSGGHIMDIYNGCVEEGIEVVDVRHEQVAAHAADAYARITGGVGCAAVTAGPGTTDAVTGVANAWRAESPLLLLGGASPLSQHRMGALQELDHVSMMKGITRFADTVVTTERCAHMMAQAIREMFNGAPGPAFLELPFDVLNGKVPAAELVIPKKFRVKGEFIGDPNELAQAADIIAGCERPVMLAGSQVRTCRAHQVLANFAEQFNIPVYCTGAARGSLPRDHRQNMVHSRRTAFEKADVVFIAGTPLDFRLGYGKRFHAGMKLIHLDMDYRNVGHNRDFDIGLVGNVRAILQAMCDANPGDRSRKHDSWMEQLRDVESANRHKYDAIIADDRIPIHPARLCYEINEFLLEDTVFIGDGGDIVTFSGTLVQPHKPGGWMDPGPLGTLGVGTPFALASKLAQPERDVIVLFGDGSFGLTGFDFETMTRKKLPFVGVIGNNGAWNQVRYGQVLLYGEKSGDVANLLGDVRYDDFARALGGYGERVTEPSQIRPALERARDSGLPALIDVVIDREIFSDSTKRQTIYQ